MTEKNGSKVKGILITLTIILILAVVLLAACQSYMIWHPAEKAFHSTFDLHDGEAPNGIQYKCELEGETYEAYVKYEDDFNVVTIGTSGAMEREAEDIEKYDLPFEEKDLDAHNEGVKEANAFMDKLVQMHASGENDAKEIDVMLREYFESRGGTVTIADQVGTPLPEE